MKQDMRFLFGPCRLSALESDGSVSMTVKNFGAFSDLPANVTRAARVFPDRSIKVFREDVNAFVPVKLSMRFAEFLNAFADKVRTGGMLP